MTVTDTFEPPRVLIVDDLAELRAVIADVLLAAGFDTIGAANGRDACDLLSAGADPAIILLDFMMPVMDGLDFLRAAAPTVPVILMTGDATELPLLPPCVVQVLQKPLTAGALIDAVRAAANGRLQSPKPEASQPSRL